MAGKGRFLGYGSLAVLVAFIAIVLAPGIYEASQPSAGGATPASGGAPVATGARSSDGAGE